MKKPKAATDASSTVLACNLAAPSVMETLAVGLTAPTAVDNARSRQALPVREVPITREKRRQDHLRATITHFNDLSTEYDHYALKRLAYLENVDNIIHNQIDRREPCSYLDVGCGTGRLLGKIQKACPSCQGRGIDISLQMTEICRAKGLNVSQADFFAYQPETSFDVVFLEFNVFGYLIVQNGLADTVRHLRRLTGDRGCIVFDILNPLCLTYGRLRDSLPTALRRCCNLLAQKGESQFTYTVGGNPIAMGLASPAKVEEHFSNAGFRVERHLIKYADHRWLKVLPSLFTSQFLFVCTRQ